MTTKKATTKEVKTAIVEKAIPENVIKAKAKYKKLLTKFKVKEGERYQANFEFKELIGKTKVDEVEFNIDTKFDTSPMLLVNCYLDNNFVGNFALADKNLITDKYDRDAVKDELNVPQNTRQYDIKFLNQKFIDNFKIKL